MKIISESISDMSAQGVALDAGIQYVTGTQENIHFGITLKNIGPTMKFSGDGLSLKLLFPDKKTSYAWNNVRKLLNCQPSFLLVPLTTFLFENNYRFTMAGNFTSNSFTKDQITLGGEFSLKEYLLLRAGYTYEEGIWDDIETSERTNVNKGLSLGFSVQVPLNKEAGSVFQSIIPTEIRITLVEIIQ